MSTTPQRLGKYELQHLLGRGSVGEVWKAHDSSVHRDVAIKLLHADLQQSDPNFMTRFITEGQAITALHHANIVQVYDVDIARSAQSSETVAYIAYEYVEGQTLADYLKVTSHKGNFPSVSEIVYLFTSLGVAIDYAHQQGIIHGDIKPGNILLNKRNTLHFAAGEPLLIDFGLTQILETDHGNGSVATIADPFYMSPEQARGWSANNRSDIYALGVMLYEICTGVLPFRDESSVAVMMQQINTLPTPPMLINPNIPPTLSEVILRAMAKDTATRFSLASLLAAAIADACAMQTTIQITRGNNSEDEESQYQSARGDASILGVAQRQQFIRTRSSSSQPLFPLTQPSQPIPRIPAQPSQPIPRIPSQPLPGRVSQPLSSSVSQPLPRLVSQPLPGTSAPLSTNSGRMPAFSTTQATEAIAAQPTLVPAGPPSGSPAVTTMPTTHISIPETYGQQETTPIPARPADAISTPVPASRPPQFTTKSRILNFADTPVYIMVGALVLLLVVLGSAIGASLFLNRGQASTGGALGHIFFQDDALGHADQIRIQMQNIAAPPDGKSYYVWLQDTSQHAQRLGSLAISNNGTSASLLYQGDSKHTNLLSTTQSVLVTIEDSGSTPAAPTGTTVYRASFDAATLQALKNILYQTPGFPTNQGVAAGLVDTIKSMNDKAQSIVDSENGHDYTLALRQATRIIEMIDGTKYASSSGDLPARVPHQINTSVGLISSPTQTGYIDTLDKQLDQMKQAAGNDTARLQHIQNVKNAITDLRDWIQKIRTYDVQLLKAADLANPTITGVALQLSKAAADSYTGRTLPPNQGPTLDVGSAGAYQAYTECEYLATLDVQAV